MAFAVTLPPTAALFTLLAGIYACLVVL